MKHSSSKWLFTCFAKSANAPKFLSFVIQRRLSFKERRAFFVVVMKLEKVEGKTDV
jgi:hypothetical protein